MEEIFESSIRSFKAFDSVIALVCVEGGIFRTYDGTF